EELAPDEKMVILNLVSALGAAGGGLATGDTSGMVSAGNAARVEVENNFFGKALVEGCAIAAPCRTKIAEQLLEIGVKAGITGVVAKEIADNLSSEELEHLVTLEMMGNDEITGKYLSSLQDKYAPSNTGGNQITNPEPTNTGGDQIATGNVPAHTGNNQVSDQGATNTGNTDGVLDSGGNTTVTPIPDGPSKDDLAYLAEGRDNRLPIPEPTVASNGLKIESNPKHTPGASGSRANAGVEPKNSLSLFENSIATKDPKIRLSIDNDGNIHRFFNTSKDGSGAYHWSGSSGDGKNALGNRELGSFNKEIKELKGRK
ncbi:VENN motif pre-toxin domain-containing protein, partial [Lonsdalea quercina]